MSPTVMRGVVTRIKARKPYVEIPDLGVGYEFGPCEVASGIDLERGDRVLVVSVSGIPEDVVVVNKLDPEDDAGRLERRYDGRFARLGHGHSQGDVTGLTGRLSDLEGQLGRVATVEGGLADLAGRVAALESQQP